MRKALVTPPLFARRTPRPSLGKVSSALVALIAAHNRASAMLASCSCAPSISRRSSAPADRARGAARRAAVRAAASDANARSALGLRPQDYETREIAIVSARPVVAAVKAPNKFQEFGRAYWPAFAALEGVALIGATVNGILSRKRREEIARLNTQMRGIMAKLDAREKAQVLDSVDDADAEAMSVLADAKRELATDHNERAAELFASARDLAIKAKDASTQFSASKGLGMALAAQRKFPAAAAALEDAIATSKRDGSLGDSAAYGLLGDVYTDMGAFDRAGAAYDLCIRAMDD